VSSKSLDDWAVQLQRLGRWQEAGRWFRRALDLNPDNLAARINVIFNERCRRGDTNRLGAAAVELEFRDLFARLGDWMEILSADGPVDEPTFLFRTSRLMLLAGHNRQAVAGFVRCVELAPDWMAPRLWLARGHLRLGNFAEVLNLTDQIQGSGHPLSGAGLAELLDCRATALRALGQTNEAAVFIEGFLSRYREQSEVVLGAADLYAQSGQREQELALLDEMLRRDPNRAGLLSRKGFVQMQLSRPADAIVTLTRALSLAPADAEARLFRAVSYLRAGQLDPAWDDYQELLKTGENSRNALFGLGTVAWRKHDTNSAVEFYQQFLSNAIPRSRQSRIALDRLQQLKEGGTP
jgi:tetratricopeptide (TPR) repeat protein